MCAPGTCWREGPGSRSWTRSIEKSKSRGGRMECNVGEEDFLVRTQGKKSTSCPMKAPKASTLLTCGPGQVPSCLPTAKAVGNYEDRQNLLRVDEGRKEHLAKHAEKSAGALLPPPANTCGESKTSPTSISSILSEESPSLAYTAPRYLGGCPSQRQKPDGT